MKNLFKFLIVLMLTVPSLKGISQKQFLHLTYKPTSYIVLDSMFSFEEYDKDEVISAIAGFDSSDVYITPEYFASIAYNSSVLIHTVYNRKTRIIRRHLTHKDSEFFSEDSVMYYLHKDKKLRAKAESLKDSLGITEYPTVQKTIHGKKCHLMTHPVYYFFSEHNDSIWLADFKDIPQLIGSGFGFLITGVPLQYEVNHGLVSVLVESKIKYETDLPMNVFTIDPGLSDINQIQTQNKIPDFMTYFRKNRP